MIKVRPEEFQVSENADLPLVAAGSFRVYRLTKKGLTTEDACRLVSREFAVPLSWVSWGGRKDKYGLTTQYITVREGPEKGLESKNLRVEPVGLMDRPIGPDIIQGNWFQVTLRRLKTLDGVLQALDEVKDYGFPNFFDDQRFRSYDPERGFFAEKILRRPLNGALQVYLTSITESQKKREKERRRAFLAHWKDWPKCLELAQTPEEKKILAALAAEPNNLEAALKFIPPEEVSFLYAAYQAHLWNELLRRLLRKRGIPLLRVTGREGDYLFWKTLNQEDKEYLHQLALPTAACRMNFPDELTRNIFLEILEEKGLRLTSFRTKVLRLVSFRSFPRPAAAMPQNLQVIETAEDDLYPGFRKITLSFGLGRGSYGTMLIKRLTL